MFLTYVLFLAGFGLLIKGADWLVDGSSSLAKRFGISTLAIGLTLVAFGTSTPELLVNVYASAMGNTDIAIGNILGSNTVNILLILGVSAVIYPLTVTQGTVWKEIPLALLAAIAVAIMANDPALAGRNFSELDRGEGLILMAFFIIFLYYIWHVARLSGTTTSPSIPIYSLIRSNLMCLGGLAALVIGGKWVVDGAIVLAQGLGVSQTLIGLTVVGVGTSLPELATSAVAAYKRNSDIAVGNIVGSNIFNVFWILGLSAVIRPLPFRPELNFDIAVTVIATLLLFATMFVGRRCLLERWQGVGFIFIYLGYLAFIAARG